MTSSFQSGITFSPIEETSIRNTSKTIINYLLFVPQWEHLGQLQFFHQVKSWWVWWYRSFQALFYSQFSRYIFENEELSIEFESSTSWKTPVFNSFRVKIRYSECSCILFRAWRELPLSINLSSFIYMWNSTLLLLEEKCNITFIFKDLTISPSHHTIAYILLNYCFHKNEILKFLI